MSNSTGGSILTAACFRFGLMGAQVTQRFSDRIEQLGLTHKQVGLLAVVDAGLASSQRDIATCLRVAPSLVVSLVDQLLDLGAISRARSSVDRRVQVVQLTAHGRELLAIGVEVAEALDQDLRATLSDEGRAALDTLLGELERQHPLAPDAAASSATQGASDTHR